MSILEVQTMLRDAGFNPGSIDGKWGNQTRTALADALRIANDHAPRPSKPVKDDLANAIAVMGIIDDAMALLPKPWHTAASDQLLLTITGQEADFHHRWQVTDLSRPDRMGPARGLAQFERGGAVKGVLNHERTRSKAIEICRMRNVAPTIDAVYNRLHADDILAMAFARLLCWSSPAALPAVGDVDGAWKFYLREWRPGAYTRGTTKQREELRAKFGRYYATALEARKAA